MTVLWNKIKKNVIDSFNVAIDKTEELTSVGRIKLEMLQVEHRLDEKYVELGKRVYSLLSAEAGDISRDEQVQKMQTEIVEIEKELGAKEAELGRIKREDGINFDS